MSGEPLLETTSPAGDDARPRQPLEQALAAAADRFASTGFDATSFRDLTEVTGMKRSLLLYHFGSKEELWRRAMLHIVARFDVEIAARPLPPATEPDEVRVPAMLRAYIDALIAVPAYGQVLIREGVTAGPRLDWLVKHFVPTFAVRLNLTDPARDARLRGTMLRDLVIGAPLIATALGPFLEASTASASKQPSAGIHPMSDARRDELIDLVAGLLLG